MCFPEDMRVFNLISGVLVGFAPSAKISNTSLLSTKMPEVFYPQYHLKIPSHHPRGIKGDALLYRNYALAICEMLSNTSVENTGMTIGIFGDWGMGKSSVLQMVQDLLVPKKDSTDKPFAWIKGWNKATRMWIRWGWKKKFSRAAVLWQAIHRRRAFVPLVVSFDAWKYGQSEAVWIGFLKAIVRSIDEQLKARKILGIKLSLWFKRIQWKRVIIKLIWLSFWLLAWLFILSGSLQLIQYNLPTLLSLGIWDWLQTALGVTTAMAALWAMLRVLVDVLVRGSRAVLAFDVALYPILFRPTLMEEAVFPFETFQRDMLDIIEAIGRPVVVLIDDLDRCPTDQIVPVLEAMKYFDFVPSSGSSSTNEFAPITFVLAADRGAIERAVRGHFIAYMEEIDEKEKDLFAREYIEKIVQVPFELPPLTSRKLGDFLNMRVMIDQLQ